MNRILGGGRAYGRYEAALGVALASLAFLSKDNPQLVLPECLWLFLVLLATSLAASLAVRLRPERPLPAALALVASFIVVAAIQSQSGGSASDLWVLYLLPIFSAAILLGGRETAWIAAGAVLTNAAGLFAEGHAFGAADAFALVLKTSILAGAAAATWSLSKSEREAGARAARQRDEIERLEGVAVVAAGGAGAVHDLGAPLTVILGYASLRHEDETLPQAVREDMARIERSAQYCQELVRGLMTSRDAAMITRSASEVVESALSLCEDPLRARKVGISREFPPETCFLRAKGRELERVLVNLIGNAAKAMPGGGRISVSVALAGPRVVLSVDDDGPGIPTELLPRLFTPFATGHAKEGGVGLGLYLCREIARRHGGDLTVGRSPRGGARFEMTLPGAAAAEGPPLGSAGSLKPATAAA
ncbi:MAG: HAMP domain-containing sensor histidine kinase [Elusimicrobia bacterium]|nr:HAMP domain-containing sensor histidine kinase [Elusimicrobiota bacterium]